VRKEEKSRLQVKGKAKKETQKGGVQDRPGRKKERGTKVETKKGRSFLLRRKQPVRSHCRLWGEYWKAKGIRKGES